MNCWKLNVNNEERKKLLGSYSLRRNSTVSKILPLGTSPSSHSEYPRTWTYGSGRRSERIIIVKYIQSVFHKKAYSQGKRLYQSFIRLTEGQISNSSLLQIIADNKMQTLFWGESWGCSKVKKGDKTRHRRNLKTLVPSVTPNMKHSAIPTETDIKLHSQDLLPQFLFLIHDVNFFNKNYKTCQKVRANTVLTKKAIIETRLRYDRYVGIITKTKQNKKRTEYPRAMGQL